MITVQDAKDAQILIAGAIHRTPLLSFPTLDEHFGLELLVKPESLNKTGSFKIRGVTNAVRHFSPEEKARGLITLSAGNTGRSVAYVAREEGLTAVVIMADFVPESKIKAARLLGAEVEVVPSQQMGDRTEELIEEHGYAMIHPLINPLMMAGNGTIALEILEDRPDVEAIVVPVGGGGLISGVSATVKEIDPRIKVFGVQARPMAAIYESWVKGEIVTITPQPTIAEGLAAPWALPEPFSVIQRYADDIVAVSDNDIQAALDMMRRDTFLPIEPAGAAGFAALATGAISLPPGTRVAVIVTGGNS